MICIYRQKKYGAHFCFRYHGDPKHCGFWNALACAVKDVLGSRLVAMGAKLRRVAR